MITHPDLTFDHHLALGTPSDRRALEDAPLGGAGYRLGISSRNSDREAGSDESVLPQLHPTLRPGEHQASDTTDRAFHEQA